jgi:hypothetical protein
LVDEYYRNCAGLGDLGAADADCGEFEVTEKAEMGTLGGVWVGWVVSC